MSSLQSRTQHQEIVAEIVNYPHVKANLYYIYSEGVT